MLTTYQQYLDACRELCRAQADVVATVLADAERVNQATGRLLDSLQTRHETSRQRIESAENVEQLFDISATTLGEDIATGTQTFMQMWREIAEVQVRAMSRLPEHVSQLGTLSGRVMQFAGGMPQPLIPLGSWLYGIGPAFGMNRRSTDASTPATDPSRALRERAAG
jgi:predicted transposase YdaD